MFVTWRDIEILVKKIHISMVTDLKPNARLFHCEKVITIYFLSHCFCDS